MSRSTTAALRRPTLAAALAALVLGGILVAPAPAGATGTLLSLGQPVTSSGVNAELANDADPGNGGGFFDAELVGGVDAWWQVDLGATYSLTEIVNRNYVDGVRFYHYYVRTSLDGENWSAPIAWKFNDIPAADPGESFAVTGVGRYVRVNIIANSANASAHLTNFEVYGTLSTQSVTPTVAVGDVALDAPTYVDDDVPVLDYRLTNTTGAPVTVAHTYAIVFGLSDPRYRRFVETASNTTIAASASVTDSADLWAVDSGMPDGAYGVFVRVELADGSTWERFETFFRVAREGQLTRYSIDVEDYLGFPVYTQDGGLSAEYAVLKSAQILSQSAGPSWTPSDEGYGPRPVYATPGFLREAIDETITTLDTALGATRQFDTAIVAPGIQSTPQLISTLQAPVLPLHYLVSFDSVYELRGVLDQAARDGYEVMTTLGHDGSMDPGVAWIKLLEPPAEYLDFLDRHGVSDVVIAGTFGTSGGENLARRALYAGSPTSGANPGDIIVVYPGGSLTGDGDTITRKVHDLSDLPLGASTTISDWEAGLIDEQVDAFAAGIKTVIPGSVAELGAETYYDIDNLGIFVSAAYFKKNEAALEVDGEVIRGIALSPYMTNQPFADVTNGVLPVLFFQGENPLTIVQGRIVNQAASALAEYFPDVVVTDLHVDVITSRNFGGFANGGIQGVLIDEGFTSYAFSSTEGDEIWSATDNHTAWNEIAVQQLAAAKTQGQWTTWNAALSPLDLADLATLPCLFPAIHFELL